MCGKMTEVSPQVRDYMSLHVVTIDASGSVLDAAREIVDNSVGCVVVMKNDDIAGIVTKGDILKKSLLRLEDPGNTRVSKIMSTPVVTIAPGESLETAAKLMSERHVSKLPVLDDVGLVVGLISSTDLIRIEPGYVEYLKELIHSKSKP